MIPDRCAGAFVALVLALPALADDWAGDLDPIAPADWGYERAATCSSARASAARPRRSRGWRR